MRRFKLVQHLSAAALVLVGSMAVLFVPQAYPQSSQRDLAAPARQAVSQIVYASTATSAAAERSLDARTNEQRHAIEALAQRLTQAGERNETLAAELSIAQERYVGQLAERDRAYALEIAVLRGAAEDIAATPDGLAALQRFNAGDELGALLALDRLRDARERARQARNNVESAAEARDIATLALEVRNRGRLDTRAVIARYEEVTQLDPGVHWDWVELGRLYVNASNLPQARHAAERAAETAVDDRSRGVALHELGVVQQAQGDLRGARESFEQYHAVAQRLAQADPSSAPVQRDVAVSQQRLGDVLVAQGDLNDARARYEESLRIYQRLAAAYPGSAILQRDVSVNLEQIGDVLVAQGDLAAARISFEQSLTIRQRLAARNDSSTETQRDVANSVFSLGDLARAQGDLTSARRYFEQNLTIRQRLAQADPSSALAQRDVSVALIYLGDVLIAQGDLAAARAHYDEGLRIFQRLAATDPSSSEAQRDVAIGNERLGNVLLAQGNLVEARVCFEARLHIIQGLAQADPSSAGLQRDLVVSYVKLQEATGDPSYAQRALDVALRMQQRGQLAPSDVWMIDELRRRSRQ